MKKLVQTYEKSKADVKDKLNKEEIAKKKSEEELDIKTNQEETDDLLGDLNPRYFEEVMTLEKAKQRD